MKRRIEMHRHTRSATAISSGLKRVLAVLAVLLVLPACGPAAPAGQAEVTPEAAAPSGEQKTLTIWYWGEQEAPGLKAYMEKAAETYMQQYPDVKVETFLQGEDLRLQFRAAAQAEKGPDIQYFWGGTWTLEDAWLGNLAPISDYWSEEELAHLPIGQRAETYWDGKQWGLPFYQIGTFWVYNKKLFSQAGLDPQNPPATWDEYLDACTKLKAIGVIPIGLGMKDGQFGGWLISYFGEQNLDSIDDLLAAIRGEQDFTENRHAEWWSRLDELIKAGCFPEDVMSIDGYQGQQLFETGEAAMAAHVQPFATQLERTLGVDTVGLMRTPVYGTGEQAISVGVPVQTLAITSFSPNKELAADYLRFMHTPEMMKLQYDMAGAVTPDDRFDPAWFNTEVDRTIQEWSKEYPLFWYQYYYPPIFETEGAIAQSQLLFAGATTPEAAAQAYQDVAEKWRTANPDQVANYAKWTLPPEMFGEQ
jgi:raffinose/stachyose/melibiose transport system substrate-binding protein